MLRDGLGLVPVTVEDVRAVARDLPRAYEVVVHDRVKFRVGQIVWLAFSRDETTMGFAFPKEEREALVASDPGTFLLPGESDLRYRWVVARMAALDVEEMTRDRPRRLANGRAEERRGYDEAASRSRRCLDLTAERGAKSASEHRFAPEPHPCLRHLLEACCAGP